uniref:Uncharacterized protein n=1 Tax=Arundo donax TaxID=35708 RepID=A0A0A9HJL2_ARUDO
MQACEYAFIYVLNIVPSRDQPLILLLFFFLSCEYPGLVFSRK